MTTQTLSSGTVVPSPMLVAALRGDAVVSSGPALLQLAWSGGLSALAGLPQALVLGTGVFFVAWIALLLWMASRPRLPRALVLLVIGGNTLWAVGCVELAFGATPLGAGYLVLQALGVLALAAWQFAGLRRSVQ